MILTQIPVTPPEPLISIRPCRSIDFFAVLFVLDQENPPADRHCHMKTCLRLAITDARSPNETINENTDVAVLADRI